MSTPLRGTRLIDLCTASISYDRQVQSGCAAFDQQMFEIIDETGQIIFIPNIMNLKNETLVDVLAWQFHVDLYDATRDLDFRKRLVQMSIIWHATKGTVALVQDVLDTYWPGGASIEEWFQYKDPFPPNYPINDPDIFVGTFTAADVNITTDRITIPSHGLAHNTVIRFTAGIPPLPQPLVQGIWYYVSSPTTNNFQVAPSFNGSPINLTSTSRALTPNEVWRPGSGTWHDRYKFRILIDEQIISPADHDAVLTLIDRYKPVSRWCEGIFRVTVSQCDIGWTGMLLRFVYRTSEAPTV
jgi:phage tail P2-like protein